MELLAERKAHVSPLTASDSLWQPVESNWSTLPAAQWKIFRIHSPISKLDCKKEKSSTGICHISFKCVLYLIHNDITNCQSVTASLSFMNFICLKSACLFSVVHSSTHENGTDCIDYLFIHCGIHCGIMSTCSLLLLVLILSHRNVPLPVFVLLGEIEQATYSTPTTMSCTLNWDTLPLHGMNSLLFKSQDKEETKYETSHTESLQHYMEQDHLFWLTTACQKRYFSIIQPREDFLCHSEANLWITMSTYWIK